MTSDFVDDASTEFWFERDGAKLLATSIGKGPPIILLHGGLATHHACQRFAAPLAARFQLITPDLRASGRSRYAGGLTWDQLADDVAALVTALGFERVVIGGISFGAGCAIRVALRHPGVLAGLVLLHPAFAGADVGLTEAQKAAMQAIGAVGNRVLTEGVQALYPLFEALPAPIRARARASVDSYDAASVATSTRFMASGAQPFASAVELASISVPTLIVPGTDSYHPVEVAEIYRTHVPRAIMRSVETAEFAATIAEFVDREVTCCAERR
jgi:3-oxoadipate enol-lactonase